MDIKGSVALVTGANRGIGRAFVEVLLAQGAAKVYAAARKLETLDEIVALDKDRVVPLQIDVTKDAEIRAAADSAGDVNLLLNNAGTAQFQSLLGADSLDAARLDMETNYFGALAVVRAFAPILKANGGGAIVTLGSIASHVNFPMLGSYSASKAAVHSLIQGVRAELRAQGTHVVGVYPGPVDTDMAEEITMDKVPPSQIAEAALQAVTDGTEDVFPDPVSVELYGGFRQDPKALERQVAEMGGEA
ncbi:MAG: SDR family oxidoreductase [Kiloniellales bacterium]|nr:SDR family oxidoreductase [Kiloniellales bacterium]